MKVRLLFFAVLRDIAGVSERQLDLPEGANAEAVWQSLRAEFSQLAGYEHPPMTAINESYASAETELHDGDDLAFIPPIAEADLLYLTDEPISPSALVASVMTPACGALVTFSGVVRDHHEGKRVESIFYDAYRPMAEKELARIVDTVSREFPDVRVGLLHRLGLLRVGETSIVIVSASPHRSEAFAASRALIDRIKETVPIWKKERSPEGDEWVGWQK